MSDFLRTLAAHAHYTQTLTATEYGVLIRLTMLFFVSQQPITTNTRTLSTHLKVSREILRSVLKRCFIKKIDGFYPQAKLCEFLEKQKGVAEIPSKHKGFCIALGQDEKNKSYPQAQFSEILHVYMGFYITLGQSIEKKSAYYLFIYIYINYFNNINNTLTRESDFELTMERDKMAAKKIITEKPDDVSQELWDDFLAARKMKRAIVTPRVVTALRKEGEKINWSLEEVLNEILMRGWISFKASWGSVGETEKTPYRSNMAVLNGRNGRIEKGSAARLPFFSKTEPEKTPAQQEADAKAAEFFMQQIKTKLGMRPNEKTFKTPGKVT